MSWTRTRLITTAALMTVRVAGCGGSEQIVAPPAAASPTAARPTAPPSATPSQPAASIARLSVQQIVKRAKAAVKETVSVRVRGTLFIAITTLMAALALAGFATPASAAVGDEVTSFWVDYNVTSDGVLQVTETIDYSFGSIGRHGIYRDLVTREPYRDDDSKDQRYDVSNVSVDSPSGAPDEFSTETAKSNGDRSQVLRIKIGSEDETVSGYDATYVIKYDVRGALRHFADHSELYWDATGSSWDAVFEQVTVTVTVPEGVLQVECFTGTAGSTQSCPEKSVSGGKGVFGASDLPRGEQLTIVAGIEAGVVSYDTPIVVDPPSWMERNGLTVPGLAGSGAVTLAAIVAAVLYSKNGNRDQRFAGLPPGTFPPEGRLSR